MRFEMLEKIIDLLIVFTMCRINHLDLFCTTLGTVPFEILTYSSRIYLAAWDNIHFSTVACFNLMESKNFLIVCTTVMETYQPVHFGSCFLILDPTPDIGPYI